MTSDGDLADIRRIREVVLGYCRGIDRLDPTLVRATFHPDAVVDYGVFKGPAAQFADAVVPFMRRRYAGTMHNITNDVVEVAGDIAHTEFYFVAYHRLDEGSGRELETFAGRYVDRFERRDGSWRVVHRVVVHEWSNRRPLGEGFPGADQFAKPRPAPDDEAYRR